MKARAFAVFVAPLLLWSCHRAASSTTEQRSTVLENRGNDALADGDRLLKEGLDLQDQAKELRAAAGDDRRQANLLDSQGEFQRATSLRLDANRKEAEATESEYRGRELELRGRDLLQRGQALIDRGERSSDGQEPAGPGIYN